MKEQGIPALSDAKALESAAYWLDFFIFSQAVRARTDPVYLAFESAFPLPDFWMILCLFLAVISFYRGKNKHWIFFGLLGAASMIFLALIDVHFNINQGNYPLIAQNSAMAIEVLINLWLLSVGAAAIRHFWKLSLPGP